MEGRWQLFASLENPPNDSLSLARLIMNVLQNNCDLGAPWGIANPDIVELTQAHEQLLLLLTRANVRIVRSSRGVHQITFLNWESLNQYKTREGLSSDFVLVLVQTNPGEHLKVVATKDRKDLQEARFLDCEENLHTFELSKSQRNQIFAAIEKRDSESRIPEMLTAFSTAIKGAFPLKPLPVPIRPIPVWKPLQEVTKPKTAMAQYFSSVQTTIATLDQDMKKSLSVSSELRTIKSQQQELMGALSQLISDVRNYANLPKSPDLLSEIVQLEEALKVLQTRINALKKCRQKPEVFPLKLRCVKDQDGETSLVVYNRLNRTISTAQIIGFQSPNHVQDALPLKIEQFITVLPQAVVMELGSSVCIVSEDQEPLSNTVQLDVQDPYIQEFDPKDRIARTIPFAKSGFPGSKSRIQEIMSSEYHSQTCDVTGVTLPDIDLSALRLLTQKPASSWSSDQQ